MSYFFAYGARMNSDTMRDDVPEAVAIGPASLDGYRLVFNVPSRSWGGGAANAVAAPGAHLWGVLWDIGDADMKALDSFRGDDRMQQVLEIEVQGPEGPVEATTFAIDSPERFVAPTARYLAMLRAVTQDHGLPDEALAEIDAAASGQTRGQTASI
ncbi:MAG: gamma-glutamylcyclotransferase family protein [Actinomycetota bacterium]